MDTHTVCIAGESGEIAICQSVYLLLAAKDGADQLNTTSGVRKRNVQPFRLRKSHSHITCAHTNLLNTASSSSSCLFVAPNTRIRSCPEVATPSICNKNSVFILNAFTTVWFISLYGSYRREASCSPADLADNILSISSIKITDGCRCFAIANNARTNFSPSPTHLETSAVNVRWRLIVSFQRT